MRERSPSPIDSGRASSRWSTAAAGWRFWGRRPADFVLLAVTAVELAILVLLTPHLTLTDWIAELDRPEQLDPKFLFPSHRSSAENRPRAECFVQP